MNPLKTIGLGIFAAVALFWGIQQVMRTCRPPDAPPRFAVHEAPGALLAEAIRADWPQVRRLVVLTNQENPYDQRIGAGVVYGLRRTLKGRGAPRIDVEPLSGPLTAEVVAARRGDAAEMVISTVGFPEGRPPAGADAQPGPLVIVDFPPGPGGGRSSWRKHAALVLTWADDDAPEDAPPYVLLR
ncbi:MAG: hypothetical protein K9N49_03750 [Candidatus Marinimicrobia bacterium]|nr:hypothetical protein [Candidatus Neomarinimicrobiota bacterium]